MAIQPQNHTDIFAVLDRVYGLIDGSATWSDCLQALIDIAAIDASRLLLYDCARGQSHIAEAAGIGYDNSRTTQPADVDAALWQSLPGEVWLPLGEAGLAERRSGDLGLCGCAVLDRDSIHILYLEFLSRRTGPNPPRDMKRLLDSVLPHMHRACRLHRSVTGDDLVAFIAPDLDQPSPPIGLPIELRLRRRFKLSKAEARVATLLADGLAPRMIADRLNVSIHTVRSQLQAIFNKTDTSRQAELTSLILRETDIPRSVCQNGALGAQRDGQIPCP